MPINLRALSTLFGLSGPETPGQEGLLRRGLERERLVGSKHICSVLAPYHWLFPVTLHVLGNTVKTPFAAFREIQKGMELRINRKQGLSSRREGEVGRLGKQKH